MLYDQLDTSILKSSHLIHPVPSSRQTPYNIPYAKVLASLNNPFHFTAYPFVQKRTIFLHPINHFPELLCARLKMLSRGSDRCHGGIDGSLQRARLRV